MLNKSTLLQGPTGETSRTKRTVWQAAAANLIVWLLKSYSTLDVPEDFPIWIEAILADLPSLMNGGFGAAAAVFFYDGMTQNSAASKPNYSMTKTEGP